ncbi:MAG: hypothetical protein JST22_15040 [Bacteroidetes bacterium]|nr:hypothetical protein [Bacteroidota bacterium]
MPGAITLLLVCIGLAACATCAHAQDEADSTWDDYGANPERFKLDDDIFGHVSTGWFPQAYTGYTLEYGGTFFLADAYDVAPNIRSRAFAPTTEPFTQANPFTSSSERKILKPNSQDEESDGYPATDYSEYMLTFLYNLPMPAVVRLQSGLQVSEGMLFSNDTSRSFLTIGGAMQPFKEVGVIHLKQYSLLGSIGLVIPVYGGFIDNEAMALGSYYYVYGGISAAYAVSSKGTQYSQIADAKDEIRYGNGSDTATLINKRTFDGLNRLRTAWEFAIGWNLQVQPIALSFEVFASVPRTSVLADADWKQYFVGIRASFGAHWLPDKSKKNP